MPSRLQWEVFEDHLHEAGFLLTQWERALHSPRFTLEEVAEGIERRLLAHLDALALGGPEVARRLLYPALEQEDTETLTASALVLLATGADSDRQYVLERFEHAENEERACFQRALELSPLPSCVPRLHVLLESSEPHLQAAAMEVLVAWQAEPGPLLKSLLVHSSSAVRGAALKSARFTKEPVESRAVNVALAGDNELLRDNALITALVLGVDAAWAHCRRLAASTQEGGAFPRLLLGFGGDDSDLRFLLERATSPDIGPSCLWALGFSGRMEAAEQCLELLSHETLGSRAAESFCAITGLQLEQHFLSPTLGRELDDSEVEESSPEDELPFADPEAVRHWWETHRSRFQKNTRYLLGRPLTPAGLFESYSWVPMRRCHVLAQEIHLRSRGRLQVPSRAFSDSQRAALRDAQAFDKRLNLNRPLKELSDTARPALGTHMPRRVPEASAPTRRLSGKLGITALGMVSSIGDGVVASCAASRAGVVRISALEDIQLWDSEHHELEPARGHSIPWVTEGFSGLARLTALASQALLDLLPRTELHAKSRCALFLAAPSDFYWQRFEEREELPSRHTFRREQLQHGLLQRILATTPLPVPLQKQSLFFGEAGFVQGLQLAASQLESGAVDSCIIGGVDSLVEARHAEALDALGLLKGPDNPVGFLPGEAAGFILLERAEAALRRGARVLAILDSSHGHAEPFHRLSRTPSLGRGLAKCIRDTLEPLPDHGEAPRLVIATLNGDAYRANDWGHALVQLRAHKVLNHSREWYPAATFGELGAASGAAGICMGVRGLERGYVSEEKVLFWVSGDDGSRGALHLSRP